MGAGHPNARSASRRRATLDGVTAEILSFVPVPAHVRPAIPAVMATPPLPHRSAAFREVVARVHRGLAALLETSAPVFPVLACGTGALETALRGVARRRVLCLSSGAFGDRLSEIARALGLDVEAIPVPWGEPMTPDVLERALEHDATIDTVALVHSETATGVLCDVEALADVVASRPGTALVVDAVSSLAGVHLRFDRLGPAAVLAATTGKCLACPPGMSVLAVGPEAAERARDAEPGGYALDLARLLEYHADDQVPQTPATPLFHALDAQLERILAEGMEARAVRHRAMAARVQAWAEERFAVFAAEGARSPTVTAIENTRALDVPALLRDLEPRGYRIADGYATLAGATFRIGHMGDLTVAETEGLLTALDDVLGT